jgi:hypothetical protein
MSLHSDKLWDDMSLYSDKLWDDMSLHSDKLWDDMSLYSDTFWLWTKQSLHLLLIAAYLAEKQQIPVLYSLVWPDQDSNLLEVSMLTIIPLT